VGFSVQQHLPPQGLALTFLAGRWMTGLGSLIPNLLVKENEIPPEV
jgi:hypothetical protein